MGVLSSISNYFISNPWIIIVLLLLYCFIYALSVLFSGPKPGRNPFSVAHVRPPKPLVTDHKLRKKVLKQKFKSQTIPENIDTIVIGSGIGGLSTAVLLGRAGYKVLVLEQHDRAGGCCHTFKDKGFEFDTGIHYVGKMMEGDKTRVLIDQITEGQVVWEPMDQEFDAVAIGSPEKAKWYTMASGSKEIFASHLEKQFPTEKEAIAKFMQLLKDSDAAYLGVMIPKMIPRWLAQIVIKTGIYDLVMRKYLTLCRKSVKNVLDELTDNAEFKAVLAYIFGDLGVVPSGLSMVNYASLINHYIPGAFYPYGGPGEIAFQIIPIIERYGGRVITDAPVTDILINDKGRAHGVRVSKNGTSVDLFAKKIISDAGVINTFKHLLPKEVAVKAPLYKYIQEVGPSISYVSVFIGMNGSSQELGLKKSNTWAFLNIDYEKDMEEFKSKSLEEAVETECPLMFISSSSAKDSSFEERYPGKSVMLIITLMPWEWTQKWEECRVKHRGDEYENLKMKFGQQLWRQVEQLYPSVEGKLDYIDVGTPVSNKHYLGQPEGEMYGLEHNIRRYEPDISMHLRAHSGIPGLYLTGQDLISAGFSGALHAGLVAASAILHRNLLNDIGEVTKETRKLMKAKVDNGKKSN
ncbi:all-trans-retinol 13,14-reductase-like [Ruditapes philippinarum]|uniref:all-trans-retinol 13,14-reductase-like n=1 Tax=Ruditapes philippinarum TaxID=129788 RepID=UPI00295B81D0|nr:all-trans-retinol 13,14-reductase-like [Ruditapes philippinarum]